MGSYKQMLRDRMPATLSLALKWCKAKERWINYVYDRWIKPYPKNQRSNVVKIVLGTKRAYTLDEIKFHFAMMGKTIKTPIPNEALYFEFKNTIDLSFNGSDVEYWKYVISWVNWFKKNMAYIQNDYEISKKTGTSDGIKEKYCSFLDETWSEKLYKYLIDYLENV